MLSFIQILLKLLQIQKMTLILYLKSLMPGDKLWLIMNF